MSTIAVMVIAVVVIALLVNRITRLETENRALHASLNDWRAACDDWMIYARGLESTADSIRDLTRGMAFVDTPLPIKAGKSSTQMSLDESGLPAMVIPEFIARSGKTVILKTNGNGNKNPDAPAEKKTESNSGVSSEETIKVIKAEIGDLSEKELGKIAGWLASDKTSGKTAEYAGWLKGMRKHGKS